MIPRKVQNATTTGGPQIKGWQARKWGRLVGYHRLGLPVCIEVVYKRPQGVLPGLVVGALRAKYQKLM
jgi:hypothetical protein